MRITKDIISDISIQNIHKGEVLFSLMCTFRMASWNLEVNLNV